MTTPPNVSGMLHLPSLHSVSETLDHLTAIATSKGLTIFARIDFAKDAAANGLTMRAAELVLLGNPKAGTPLMVAAPTVAIDLPLKVLAWEDGAGQVWLSINTAEYLRERHGFPAELMGKISRGAGGVGARRGKVEARGICKGGVPGFQPSEGCRSHTQQPYGCCY